MATLEERLNNLSKDAFMLYMQTKDLCDPKKDRILSQEETALVLQRNNHPELIDVLGLEGGSVLRFEGRPRNEKPQKARERFQRHLDHVKSQPAKNLREWLRALPARVAKAELGRLKEEENRIRLKNPAALSQFLKLKETLLKGLRQAGIIK